jgi:hypothetical protein
MQDLSLHILDVAENGIIAGANLILISVTEDLEKDTLEVLVEDNGKGMDAEFLARVLDPFVTTRTTRKVGLGLSLLQQSARDAEGDLYLESRPGVGTRARVTMRHGHIDRKPLGNMVQTIITLIEGNPDTDFVYRHTKDGRTYSLDTREIRAGLEEIPLNTPSVVALLKENLEEGRRDIG